ncbi:hypothetical protein [Pseudomonas sp. 21]|uniref:hypothetical protein n=1 Tax=Pseudomonas sp. 21 TaxID=1619948 RepID=UPI000A62F16E|nr:hypothetical protein [Pseudomonas sp. 21]
MELLSNLQTAIDIFQPFRKLGKIAITKGKSRLTTPYRVEKLTDDFFSSRLKVGTCITVSGVLSRYAPTYRPMSYVPTITRDSQAKVTGTKYDFESRRIIKDKVLNANFTSFQFPVQALPPIKTDDGKFCIAYLFPDTFNGLLLEEDPQKKENLSDRLLIKDNCCPIPVLIPEIMLENYSEYAVTLTGVLTLLPDEVHEKIDAGMCETRAAFYRAFHRPTSLRTSFCIDCRSNLDSDIRSKSRLESFPAAIYIEGHFEGVIDSTYYYDFKTSVPHGLDLDFSYADHPGKTLYTVEDPHISLIGSFPSIFGFYIEANLTDSRDLDLKLNKLNKFYTEFRKNSARTVKKRNNIDLSFKPDFIFDWRKQNFFHPKGVLANREVDEVIKRNSELEETALWLRGNQQ